MLSFENIGSEGLIIQFEDCISMIGFNVIRYLHSKNVLSEMSLEDILLEYINRENEDYEKWISDKIGYPFKTESFIDSINAFQPSWMYAYKVFDTARQYKQDKNLFIHSNKEIPFINDLIKHTFDSNVKYIHGDIVPILDKHPNITYLTSLPSNIKKCLDVKVPFVLTIVDDFIYTSDIMTDDIPKQLKSKNKIVNYTSIFSSGFIN